MPDTKRLRLHRSLQQQIGAALADELMEFLPPAGWGELARRSDVEFVHQRLDQKINSVEARLDQKIDSVEARLDQKIDAVEARLAQKIDALEARLDAFIVEVNEKFARINADIAELRADVRSMKRTLVVTAVTMMGSIIFGVGGIMVAFLQLAVE
ncbi:MAG: hypothetical protein RL552_253 [Actinomycetota bacterium]